MSNKLPGLRRNNKEGEYGKINLTLGDAGESVGGTLLKNTNKTQQVWMSHFDAIIQPPQGAVASASTKATPVAAFEDQQRKIYGVQFHPEVNHTTNSQRIIKGFLKFAPMGGMGGMGMM